MSHKKSFARGFLLVVVGFVVGVIVTNLTHRIRPKTPPPPLVPEMISINIPDNTQPLGRRVMKLTPGWSTDSLGRDFHYNDLEGGADGHVSFDQGHYGVTYYGRIKEVKSE